MSRTWAVEGEASIGHVCAMGRRDGHVCAMGRRDGHVCAMARRDGHGCAMGQAGSAPIGMVSFCVRARALLPYWRRDEVGPDMPIVETPAAATLSTCGHMMHADCWKQHMAQLVQACV